MELERVARRLAVDQGYRRRAAEGLRAAAGAGGAGADVLHRVKRLNEYLVTGEGSQDTSGLAILDDSYPAAALGPLPWQAAVEQQAQQARQPQHPQAASPVDSSTEDSDIEEEEGGQDDAQAVAALLAEAQAAVQRRRAAAALTIQCAFRRHRAQVLLQQLRDRRLAADRLVARALAAAYRGVCGSRRALALQTALRQLRRLRRWRLRQRLQQRLRLPKQITTADADQTAAASEAQQEQLPQHEAPPATAAAAAQPSEPGPLPAHPVPPTACADCQTDEPLAAPRTAAGEQPGSGRRVGTPPSVFIVAPGPPRAAFSPASRPCTSSGGGSSRAGSPAQRQQQQQPWQQRQVSPLAHVRSTSGDGGRPGQGCPPSPLQQGASPPRTVSGLRSSSSSRQELYRRSSSIQLLEAVQLGIDGAGGSVASQAALGVCERVQQRVQELQRCASQGRPRTAGGAAGPGHRIGRVGSARAAGQGSGRAWAGDPIPE